MSFSFSIEETFSAAHFYNQRKWSVQKNIEQFGKCYSQYGHGHDYKIKLHFLNNTMDILHEKKVLKDFCNSLDHKHLNFDIPYFKDQIPTTENIASYCLAILSTKLVLKIRKIELYERDDLFACIEPN